MAPLSWVNSEKMFQGFGECFMMPEGPLNTTSLERKYIVEKILKKLWLSFFKYGLKKVKIEGLEKMMKKNEKIVKKVSRIIGLDLQNCASLFPSHRWFMWSLRYPENGQKWPKKVKNDIFHHTHLVNGYPNDHIQNRFF